MSPLEHAGHVVDHCIHRKNEIGYLPISIASLTHYYKNGPQKVAYKYFWLHKNYISIV
jgi:hypothetical protein